MCLCIWKRDIWEHLKYQHKKLLFILCTLYQSCNVSLCQSCANPQLHCHHNICCHVYMDVGEQADLKHAHYTIKVHKVLDKCVWHYLWGFWRCRWRGKSWECIQTSDRTYMEPSAGGGRRSRVFVILCVSQSWGILHIWIGLVRAI